MDINKLINKLRRIQRKAPKADVLIGRQSKSGSYSYFEVGETEDGFVTDYPKEKGVPYILLQGELIMDGS